MERLTYTPDEIRESFRYLGEQCGHLARSHAGNWRTQFTLFIDATRNLEALGLFARLLDGHQRVSGSAWYKAASDRNAPPLPGDCYGRLALVWKLVTMAMQKANPDGFDAREKIDLPYVLVNSDLPGGSLGEKYGTFRTRYLVPFCEEVDRVGQIVVESIPSGASRVDLWDALLAAFVEADRTPAPAVAPPPPEEETAADLADPAPEPKKRSKPPKKKPKKKD